MLVGQNSFGKGAVQQLLPEPTGEGVLRATIASFMLPEGTPIEGRGLTPDVEVKSDPMQLRAATELAAERVCQSI